MDLRCFFHVSPTALAQKKTERKRTPSAVDREEIAEAARPRGRSFETWARARGWASED